MTNNNETALAVDVKREFAAKVARGMFSPVARHLRTDIAEDRLAEGIAMAFELYANSVAKGEPLPDALLVHACHLRAIDLSRKVAGAGGGHPKRDVFDPRNYTDGRVELLSLDAGLEDLEGQSTLGYAEPCIPSPARRYASAVDLESWLSSLPTDDRLLLALRQAGHTLTEISTATGRSITAVRVHLLALGRELAERAGVEIKIAA
jgi:DNA-directed RNA polymerase specialized sigma24 family protein